MTTIYKFKAGYTKLGIATAPSSAPTIKVVDSANNILVAALTATTALSNLVGAYLYSYSGADGLDLIGKFTTTDLTMDQQDLFSVPYLPYSSPAAGSTSKTQTVTDGVNPLDGVNVWVSTDIGGSNIVAQGYTDALGQVTFMLDPGTYYFWKQLAGYTFTNPQADTV